MCIVIAGPVFGSLIDYEGYDGNFFAWTSQKNPTWNNEGVAVEGELHHVVSI